MQPCFPFHPRRALTPLAARLALFVSLAFGLPASAAAAEPAGIIAGRVSNDATGSVLEGATVEIPALGRQEFTNSRGEFTFRGVPAGQHQVSVTYTGLDAASQTAAVNAGRRTLLDFELTSSIYQLEAFTVTGEREGNAAAITRQRSAPNVKNVVALDAFGNLPNDSAGELLIRLPGIAGRYDDEGNVTGVMIRGAAPGLNTVSVDGNQMASAGGFGRDFRTHNISGALFDEIEVTKAPTPDMPADSLGGAVNLKTRSPLAMKEKRRINYRAMARWAPAFGGNLPLRREHPVHPLLSFGYQEVFGVLGGDRNLGVSLNLFYSENVNSIDATILDYQNTTGSPAYVWDYRRQNAFNNRTQQSAALKLDYQVSERMRVFVNTIVNQAPEKFNRLYTVRAFSTQSIAAIGPNGQPTGTNPILPGFTENRTDVRPVNGAVVELNSTLYSFIDKQRQIQVGAEHDFDRLKLDYDGAYSHSKPKLESSYRDGIGGGIFTMQARSVGWTLDKSASAVTPAFAQTAGPSIHDEASYGSGRLTSRNNDRFTTIKNASANAQYALPTAFAASIKTGVRWRDAEISERGGDRRWDYAGSAPLSGLVDRSVNLNFFDEVGGRLPFVESAAVGRDIRENPQNWDEDVYYREERTYVGTRSLHEEVSAAYVQASARLGPLSVLGGVRAERTEVTGKGYIASRVRTTTAERNADPVGAAARDYAGNLITNEGRYTDWFPGVHLVYKFTPNLQGRASWSNSVGRPPGSNLIPARTFSDVNQTVTISNPALKPQYSENWDVTLEYYFEPVGQLSAGVFRKDITDFIISNMVGGIVVSGPDNGFGGDFAGYEIRASSNGGFARIDGFELNYQQQLTFLPGPLKGLGFSANYTRLRTEGDYGGSVIVGTNEVADFVPETANAILSYKFGKFTTRVQYNYNGTYLDNAGAEARRQFRFAREMVNLSFGYQLSKHLGFAVDIINVFNEPQQLYRGYSDRLSNSRANGTAISFGISGTF